MKDEFVGFKCQIYNAYIVQGISVEIQIFNIVVIAGVGRFSGDIETMIGHGPGPYWRVCWMVVAPLFLLVSDLYLHISVMTVLQLWYWYHINLSKLLTTF